MKIMKRDRQTLLHFLGMFIGASGMREKADDVAWVHRIRTCIHLTREE